MECFLDKLLLSSTGQILIKLVILLQNSYGASWDSSCEKSWVTVQNQWVPVKKKKESQIENAWAFM